MEFRKDDTKNSQRKVLILHKLSNRESDKDNINSEIDSYFNSTKKYLDPSSKLIIGKRIQFKDFGQINLVQKPSISPKRLMGKRYGKSPTMTPSDSLVRSSILNIMDDGTSPSSLTNNVEIIDNKKLKGIFDSFKEFSSKNSELSHSNSKSQVRLFTEPNNLPEPIRSKLLFQNKNLEIKELSDKKVSKLSKHLANKINKSEDDLLMNRVDFFRFKKEILNNIENSKPLDNKYGKYKWNISLRRPEKFRGVREAYVNIRTDNNPFWAIVKERYPKDKEVTIKPGSKINTKDYKEFLRNPYLSSTSDTSIKAIENMDNLDIKGEDLYELEYQGAMSSKNNKILHKVFFDNGKAIFEKDINDLFGNKMIYKNYSEKKELVI